MTFPNNISNNNIENNHPPEAHSPRQETNFGKLSTGQQIEVVSSTNPLETIIPLVPTAISNRLTNVQQTQTPVQPTALEREPELNSQNVNNSTVPELEEEYDSHVSEVDGHSATDLQQISEEQARLGPLEAAFQVIELELEEKFDRAPTDPLRDVVEFLKGDFTMSLLGEAALKIVNQRKAGGHPREVNDDTTYFRLIFFGLLSIFKQTFNLPIHNIAYAAPNEFPEDEIMSSFDFQFFGYPSITLTGDELTVTRNEIHASLKNIDHLVAYFIEQEVWTERLERGEFAQEKENDPVFKSLRDEMDKLDEEIEIGSGEYNIKAMALRDAANKASSEWLKNKTAELLRELS
jgi:hypothetical protein